jgi:hypothetical protein
MLTSFKTLVHKINSDPSSKKYAIKELNLEQKQQLLETLKHKAHQRGASIDPNLESILLLPSFNPHKYMLVYCKTTNSYSLAAKDQLYFGLEFDDIALLNDAAQQEKMATDPSLFNAELSGSWLSDESLAMLRQLKNSKLVPASLDSMHELIGEQPDSIHALLQDNPDLINSNRMRKPVTDATGQQIIATEKKVQAEPNTKLPAFADHPLIQTALQESNPHQAISSFEQVCHEYIKGAKHLDVLLCSQQIIKYSLTLKEQKLTIKYLDLMHFTMGEFNIEELAKHRIQLFEMFKQLAISITTSQCGVKHEFIEVMTMEVMLSFHLCQIRDTKNVDLTLIQDILQCIQHCNYLLLHAHHITLTSKNYFLIARLLFLMEHAIASVQTLADKFKVANLYSNKLILNKNDYSILNFAKNSLSQVTASNQANLSHNLGDALSNANNSYDTAAKANALGENDVDLIRCLQQLEYSSEYKNSPQFQSVISAINSPNFINEDSNKDLKESLYKGLIKEFTRLLKVGLSQPPAQILRHKDYLLNSSYSIGNMVADSLLTLLKYDLIKKSAQEFLTSKQFKDLMTTLSQWPDLTTKEKKIVELYELYTAPN